MSKLFKLKGWLSVDEAAHHLSTVLREQVSKADIYRLALDGHLRLSVNLVNHAVGNIGKVVPIADAGFHILPALNRGGGRGAEFNRAVPRAGELEAQMKWIADHRELLDDGEYILMQRGVPYSETQVISLQESVTTLRGLWDLPMLGAEALDIQHALLQEVEGPELTLVNIEGTFLVSPDGERFARLLEHYSENEFVKDGKDREKYPYGDPKSYFPAGGIPSDAQVVVRTGALADFVSSLEGDEGQPSRELRADARKTYARIIGALWMKAHGDGGRGRLSKDPYTAAKSVAATLAELGLESPDADRIGRVLSQEVAAAGIRIGTSDV